MVHKDLLCFFSKYYRAALQGGFLKAGNKSVVLELKNADYQYFVGWMYTGRLPDVPRADLFALYVSADKTDMLALRRAIMTRVAGCGDYIPPEFCEAAVALNSLPSSSPLYQWLLHTYTRHSLCEYLTAEDTLPNAFLVHCFNEGIAERVQTAASAAASVVPFAEADRTVATSSQIPPRWSCSSQRKRCTQKRQR